MAWLGKAARIVFRDDSFCFQVGIRNQVAGPFAAHFDALMEVVDDDSAGSLRCGDGHRELVACQIAGNQWIKILWGPWRQSIRPLNERVEDYMNF